MKNIPYFLAIAAVMAIVSCGGNSPNSSNSTTTAIDSNKKELESKDSTKLEADVEYAVKAANGGMLEVQLGKLAATNGTSQKVVDFAKMMVDDHSKANKELMAIAASKFITMPAILDNKTQKDYDDFTKMDKKDFDKAYIDYMVKDHKEDIDEFKKEVKDGKDAEIKGFALKHIPILEHHLQMAQAASDAVKK